MQSTVISIVEVRVHSWLKYNMCPQIVCELVSKSEAINLQQHLTNWFLMLRCKNSRHFVHFDELTNAIIYLYM